MSRKGHSNHASNRDGGTTKDPESLRREYNAHFSQPVDKWSCNDLNISQHIVATVLKRLEDRGFRPRQGMRSLDVGCAKGFLTESFRLSGFDSYGLDYSEVAIDLAKKNFPSCHFLHMDGFNPRLDKTFHLIFCRGFSGANTHDLDFVAHWANRYLDLLVPGGYFLLAFTSDFSGAEASGETVNWSYAEIRELNTRLNAKVLPMFFIPSRYSIGSIRRLVMGRLTGKKHKHYFYLVYTK